jgi:hypothetical protein
MACAADGPTAVAVDSNAAAKDLRVRTLIETDIHNLSAALASNSFYSDLNPLDVTGIELRRDSIQTVLTQLSERLRNPGALPATYDVAEGSTAPDCYLNGTLNGCFLWATHWILVNGTGHVSQATSTTMSHSAVVGYSLDGQQQPNIAVGGSGFSFTSGSLEKDFSFTGADCNVRAHTIQSSATHLISYTVVGAAGQSVQLNGARNSPGGDSCEYKGLSVGISPSSIGFNQTATITIGGLKECTNASAASSNTNVVTVQEANGTTFTAFPQDAGTATITASCGTQRGSASLTVTAPDSTCTPAAATSVGAVHAQSCSPSSGGGGGTSQDCGWYTWEISFDGGVTWSPYGSPFWYCPDGSQGATAIGPVQPTGSGIVRKVAYKVSLFGTVIPGPRTVLAYADLKAHGNPVIVIDTTRASTMDLEAVLQALAPVSQFSDADQLITNGRMSAMTKPRSAAAKARAAGEDAELLRNLLSAKEADIKGIGRGRLLEVTVLR